MNSTTIVKDLDTLLDCVIDSLYSDKRIRNIEFDKNLNLHIKVYGELWDGHIDHVISKLVIDIQTSILKNYNKITGNNVKLKDLHSHESKLILRVSVDSGCSEIIAFVVDVLKAIFSEEKMESKHKAAICIALFLSIACTYTATEYMNMVIEKEKIIQDREQKEQFFEIAKQALNASELSVNYMYNLASGIGGDDSIEVNNKTFTKREALSNFKNDKKDKGPFSTYYIDGDYYVKSLNYDTEDNYIRLVPKTKSDTGVQFIDALTKFLTLDDKQRLYDMCKQADISNINPHLSLHVTVEVRDGKIETAIIVGIGEERTDSVTIQKALAKSTIPQKKAQQASLLDEKN